MSPKAIKALKVDYSKNKVKNWAKIPSLGLLRWDNSQPNLVCFNYFNSGDH